MSDDGTTERPSNWQPAQVATRRPMAGEVVVIDEVCIRSFDLVGGIRGDIVRSHIEPAS